MTAGGDDDFKIDLTNCDTITINIGDTMASSYVTNDTISWTPVTSPSFSTISTQTTLITDDEWKSLYIFDSMTEFVDVMPSMSTVKEMCEIYPGFKKAFENFKDIYDLVKGDYEARKNSDG